MSDPTPSSWSAHRAAPPPQPPSLSLSLSLEPSPTVSPALPTDADIASHAGTDAATLPASSALAQRTGQSLAHLIELTNAINTRRGSTIQHALPEGVAASGLLHAGRRGRQQAAARRGTWTAFGRQDADSSTNHAAAAGGTAAPVPVAQRFSSGATAARRFSAAVGMLHSAAAFSDESLSGLAAAKVIDAADTSPRRRHALLQAAKVRALTPSYARRGGGVLLSASVAGVDLQTGENTHLTAAAPRAPPSPSKVVARVVMEEDGLAAEPSAATPQLRTSRFASTYGMQTEMKRAIAQRAPKRAQRDSSFRQQLLLESALMIEGVKPETAAAESATATAIPADASAAPTENRSNLLTRRHRRSITAPDVPQVLTVRYDWRTVLSKPGSERSEAELTFLQGWISGLKISFFNGLSSEMLRLICKVVTLSTFGEREWIFRQGERGEHFFVILQGRVAIVIDKTLKVGEVAGQRESDRIAMEQRRERQAREAGLFGDNGAGVTSVAAEAVQSMLLRSPSSAASSPRPLSATALQRSPTSPRPGSASNRKSLNLLSPPASNAASRRTSMAPAVQEGSNNEDEEEAEAASTTPPITLLSLTPSPRKLGVHTRKLVRAAKLIGSLTRAQQRVNPGGLALSTGGVLCAACGNSGHTEAACPSKATLPSSPGPSGSNTPGPATPSRTNRGSLASSTVHSPSMLLTPQRSMATLGSPRASSGGAGFADQQQPPSPSPRRSTLMLPSPREASNEVHSPSPSASSAAAAGGAGAQSLAAAGPALTHQQYSLGLVSTEAVVAEAGVGAGFGEVALASKTNTRQASVLVLPGHGSCVCLVLHKAAYDVALKLLHEAQLTYKLNFTRELFLFARWSYEKALQFTACYTSAVPVHFPRGHIFYRQRDRADTVFFVVSGSVCVQFIEEGETSAPLLLPPSADDEGTPMEGRGRWIGATYIRDEVREAAQIAREKQTKAEEAARLKALQLAQPKWLRRASVRDKRRRHKHDVSPRYLDPTGQSRLYSKPLSAREKDEARVLALVGEDTRKVPVLRVGRDADGPRDAEGHSFWELERGSSAEGSDDSAGFSTSSSSEGRSTDTSASDDDEWTIARRAERKRAKLQAKKARRRARRAGMHVEPVYDGMAQAELQASNDGCIATMPRDGATSYQFFKIFFQQDKPAPAAAGESAKQEDERVLRITLKPQLSPAVADADGNVPTIAPHDQFDLYGGNDTCRYPSKHKHTWQASAVIGGNGVSTRARCIVIRPATDPNFQSGFVYVSVFHPLNEAAILAYQSAHKGHMPVAATGPMVQQGPAYELLVETVSAGAAGWPRGSLHTPPRVYDLSTLGALDLFGAEEVIVQHEAALASIAAAAAARERKPAPIGVAAARETVNYTELGRISTAVVSSAGGARVLMMAREHFTNHVRGNMLAELKALLRRQLLARAETLERQRTIVALTETKVPAPKRYDLKQPIKPTMPPQRPQSAHPLSTEAAALTAATPLLLSSAETAAFHHRPDLGSLTMLSQRERAQLEQAYQRGRDHARLKDAVLEQYFSRNPNAPPPALFEEKKAEGHELWTLDKDERAQAQRREILLLLQAEERAEQSLVFKEPEGGAPPLSTQLRLMPGRGRVARPGTAPIRRSIAPEPPKPTLMLMPGSDSSNGALVSSAAASSSLVPTESAAAAASAPRSADDLVLASSSLNDGSFQTMTRLEEKYAALTQQRLAKRLFGDADAAMLLSGTPPRHRTRSVNSATRDGPVFGMSGSSAGAGTLSKKGAQMAVGQGLRNHWQRERTETLFKAKLKADRHAHSAREHPFSDPSLTNAWTYLPSLYDSAAVDPQLNQLAIQLGIPQPKPMSQPRDSARAHRPAVFTPDGKPVLDADAYEEQDQAQLMQKKQRAAAGKHAARKVSVEEALRIAEIKAAAAQGAAGEGEGAEEEKQEDQPAAAGTRRASITASAPLACPVPDSLWQSERALLSNADGSPASPPPAPRGRPFVAQTELAHLAHLVRFEPPQVSSPIPRKFKNKEREQREEEKQNLAVTTSQPLQLMAGDTPTADPKPVAAAPAPVTHRFHSSSRPSSASMFGSFARATPIPAVAAAAPGPAPAASPVSVDDGSGNASEDDVFSTIFSLTQVAQGASQHNTTRNRQEETAMVLHSSRSVDDDDDAHRAPRTRSPTSRPASARADVPRGNLFIAPASISPAVGIPQRQERPAELAEKEAVKAYLREQTAGLSLAARIAQSARTLAGASSARPQSARAVLRSTRQMHSARRPHVPPSIPNKTRPDAHTMEQHSYLAILQRKQREAQEQLAKIREAGRRRWMRENNKQQRREQQEADDDDAAAAAVASSPMSAAPLAAPDVSPPAPTLYWNNQPVSGAFEAQLRADWDRVDVHEEGEREVATEAARTFIDEAATQEQQQMQTAAAPPMPPRRPSPPTHSRPASASFVMHASAYSPIQPTGARPTSAFPRPPSAHSAGARSKIRPQSAFSGH